MSFHSDRRATSRAPSYNYNSPKTESPSSLPPNLHPTTLCAIGPHAMDHDILSRLHIQTIRAMGRDFSREEFYLRIEGRPAIPTTTPTLSSPPTNFQMRSGHIGGKGWGNKIAGGSSGEQEKGNSQAQEALEPDKKFREFVASCVGVEPRMLWVRGPSGEVRSHARGIMDEVEEKGWWEKTEWGEGCCGFDEWVDAVCKEVVTMRRRLDAARA